MSEPIAAYLRSCCRQVMGERPGAGFFVTPDILVTCDHVLGARKDNTVIIRCWGTDGSIRDETGDVVSRLPNVDIAVIRARTSDNNYIELNPSILISDPVIGVGFPRRSGREEFDQFTAAFEGETFYREDGGATGFEGKLKDGQIEPGYSGGPLLNMRTRAVSGMVIATRDRRTNLGGWIIPAEQLMKVLDGLGTERGTPDFQWRRAIDAQQRLEKEIARGGQVPRADLYSQQVPPLPSHYVERGRDLEDLVARLVSDEVPEQALSIAAVHGLGGVGKTSIAIAAARSLRVSERFPDGVLWTSLGRTPQLLQTMTFWLRSLGETLDVPLSVESGSVYLRTLLQNKSMLIVIDDAWDESEVSPLLVGGSACRTLITTRRAHVGDRVGAATWTLPAMTEDESLALLARRAGARLSDAPDGENARLLVNELGHLPLALELAGALAGRGYSLSGIRDQLLAVETDDGDGISSPGRLAIDKCLSLSINLLAERDPNLWESFVRLGTVPAGVKFNAIMVARFLGKSPRGAALILNSLHDDALLQRFEGAYAMHALLRDAAQKRITLPVPNGLGISLQEAHSSVVRNYRLTYDGTLANIPDDGYIHHHLAWHLVQAKDYDDLRKLLSAEDDRGRNIWFQNKDSAGQLASYRGDVQMMLDFAIKRGSEFAPDQLLWAFCLSSISGGRRLSPTVLSTLIRSGTWTAAKGYYWAVSEENADRRLALLLSVAKTILELPDNTLDDKAGMRDIARNAVFQMKTALFKEPPNARLSRLAAELMETVPAADQEALLTELVNWCASASNQVNFLSGLPNSLRAPVLTLCQTRINALPVGIGKADLLARCIPHCPLPLLHSLYKDTLSAIDEYLALARPKRYKEPHLSARGSDNRQKKFDSVGLVAYNDPDAFESFDLSDLIVDDWTQTRGIASAIATTLAKNTPPEFREDVLKRLSALHKVGLISEEIQLPGVDGSSSFSNEHRQQNHGTVANQFTKALQELGALEGDGEIEALAGKINWIGFKEDFLAALEAGRLSEPKHSKMLNYLAKRFFWSTELELFLLRSQPDTLVTRVISKIRSSDSYFDSDSAIRICVSLLSNRELLQSVLDEYFRHGDLNQQTSAVFKLMPYLPPDYPVHLVASYADEDAVGPQISGLTEIMGDLITAINAGDLSAVVEAASNRHSEWWVVEALTLTTTKIKSFTELGAILLATTRIQNSDLRARIIGRTARRAADLGHVQFAIDAVLNIEAPSLRTDEMCELSVRLASSGDLEASDIIATRIGSIDARSRVYLGIALEMGALGRREDACHALDKIPIASIRERGIVMLGPKREEEAAITPLDSRLAMRKEVAASLSHCEIVASALNAISDEISERAWIPPIRNAAMKGDSSEVERLCETVWALSADGLVRSIAERPRMRALSLIGDAAPVVGASAAGANVVGAIEAIKTVSRWWP